MRVGTLCYDTVQGLGLLAKSFYDNGIVTDVMTVPHGRRPSQGWYPGAPCFCGFASACRFAQQMDVMLFFETPFCWDLFTFCRERRIVTILMPMHECMPARWPAKPDFILAPSQLEAEIYEDATYIPVPVDVPWRERKRASVFVHNAGNGGLRGRNGTVELLKAIPRVKSPDVRFIIRSQDPATLSSVRHLCRDYRVRLEEGTVPFEELWQEGDAFIFPEKFNGLSLPIQEAHAAGMLVMSSNRFPMNRWLPTEPLIPVRAYNTARVSGRYAPFQEAVIDPQDIAAKVDEWYGQDITTFNSLGKKYAEQHSWQALKPLYLAYLEKCMDSFHCEHKR